MRYHVLPGGLSWCFLDSGVFFPQGGTNRAWASQLEAHHYLPALPCTPPPSAAEPWRPVTSTRAMQPRPLSPFLSPCQPEEGAPAWETKSAHQQLPDGQGRPGWAGIPSSSSAPPHARSCPDPGVRGSRSHPLVAQTVALPVSWNWGCGEAAGHRSVRTGGPPAEPCGTGAAGRTCEQSTESEARGWRGSGEVGWVWG